MFTTMRLGLVLVYGRRAGGGTKGTSSAVHIDVSHVMEVICYLYFGNIRDYAKRTAILGAPLHLYLDVVL